MTVKEALEQLRYEIEEEGHCSYIEDEMKVAFECMEKRIPKKVRADEYDWCCCPNCDDTFKLLDNFHNRNRYCGNCGQSLEWHEED